MYINILNYSLERARLPKRFIVFKNSEKDFFSGFIVFC